jgi:hypothetical protein
MKKQYHQIYIGTLVLIVLITTVWVSISGYDYYQTQLSERFYHEGHNTFKASGLLGHGMGILGTLLILIGVFGYMARKRYRSLSRLGYLKHWLEFHIFLCTEGAILILFHTTFKFGGIVAISFWSMVAVVLSGVIGRFIYLQIPRSIEGRALSLQEAIQFREKSTVLNMDELEISEEHLRAIKSELLELSVGNESSQGYFQSYREGLERKKQIKKILAQSKLKSGERKNLMRKIKQEIQLRRKIKRLESMQKLFKYWHVAHLPFALIMLVIAIIHVGITLLFGYKWIF